MNKKIIVYKKASQGVSKVIINKEILSSILPPPEKLTTKEPKVRITIMLDRNTIDFFKKHAAKNDTKYQAMINEVLSKYVEKYGR